MLPRVARVRVEVGRNRAVVREDIVLPRGEWQAGDLALYVAFGAPGPPLAMDARIASAPEGWETAPEAVDRPEARPVAPERERDAGDAVALETAFRHPTSSQLLLGPPQMAGVVARVRDSDLRRALASTDAAVLQLRSLLVPSGADARGARDLVVRLGISGALPLTLTRIEVVSLGPDAPLRGAEANLCGPEADARPLAVALAEPISAAGSRGSAPTTPAPTSPLAVVRHASDDLCIRWWQ
jgi:hypothetical protein